VTREALQQSTGTAVSDQHKDSLRTAPQQMQEKKSTHAPARPATSAQLISGTQARSYWFWLSRKNSISVLVIFL